LNVSRMYVEPECKKVIFIQMVQDTPQQRGSEGTTTGFNFSQNSRNAVTA
jgi:hypothetical protein